MAVFAFGEQSYLWRGVGCCLHTPPCHSHQGPHWSHSEDLAELPLTGSWFPDHSQPPVFVFMGPVASAQVSLPQSWHAGLIRISRALSGGALPATSVFLFAPRSVLGFKVEQFFFLADWGVMTSTLYTHVSGMGCPSGFTLFLFEV